MAVDSCTPCDCPRGNMSLGTYQQGVHIILCGILAALTDATADTNVNVAEVGGVAVTKAEFGMRNNNAAWTIGDAGIASLGLVQNASAPLTLPSAGKYASFTMDSSGQAYVVMDSRLSNGTNNLLKLEDSASAANQAGANILFVRADVPVSSTTTDGDFIDAKASTYGEQWIQRGGASFLNILTATTTTVKSGVGILHRIIINKAVATGVYTIYDNTAASGTKIGTVTQPAAIVQSQNVLEYGLRFATGLTIVTSSTDDITVVYS